MTIAAVPSARVALASRSPQLRSDTPDTFLSEATRQRILASVPANTSRAYGRQWSVFAAWCAEHGRAALPATAETLAEYVAVLADAGRASATIEQAVAAIRTAPHRRAPGAARHGGRSSGAARHRRDRAESGRRARQATPVTIDVLRTMIVTCDPATARGLRDRVALVLGLALMGRRSELVALDLADVTETPDELEVLIRASKTDQDVHRVVVATSRRGSTPTPIPCGWCARGAPCSPSTGHTAGRLLRAGAAAGPDPPCGGAVGAATAAAGYGTIGHGPDFIPVKAPSCCSEQTAGPPT